MTVANRDMFILVRSNEAQKFQIHNFVIKAVNMGTVKILFSLSLYFQKRNAQVPKVSNITKRLSENHKQGATINTNYLNILHWDIEHT